MRCNTAFCNISSDAVGPKNTQWIPRFQWIPAEQVHGIDEGSQRREVQRGTDTGGISNRPRSVWSAVLHQTEAVRERRTLLRSDRGCCGLWRRIEWIQEWTRIRELYVFAERRTFSTTETFVLLISLCKMQMKPRLDIGKKIELTPRTLFVNQIVACCSCTKLAQFADELCAVSSKFCAEQVLSLGIFAILRPGHAKCPRPGLRLWRLAALSPVTAQR